MPRVFVRVSYRASKLTTLTIGAWRTYQHLPRIGESICLAAPDGDEEFTDECYLEEVKKILHYPDGTVLDLAVNLDYDEEGSWIEHRAEKDRDYETQWREAVMRWAEYFQMRPMDDEVWLADE